MNQEYEQLEHQLLTKNIIEIIQHIEACIQNGDEKFNPEQASINNLTSFLLFKSLLSNEIEKLFIQEGFCSIHHMTPHILYSLKKILSHLGIIMNSPIQNISVNEAEDLLKNRNNHLFGKSDMSIMVTLDQKMLRTPKVIEDLLKNGMNIARINCANGNPETWKQLIDTVRLAEYQLKRTSSCKIYMDIAGPKIRILDILEKNNNMMKQSNQMTITKGDCIRIYKSKLINHNQHSPLDFALTISFPKAIKNARKLDRVFLDDGIASGYIVNITEDYLDWKVTSTVRKQVIINCGKGLNLPDSFVHSLLPTLTKTDIEHLPFVCSHADIIGLSFVHRSQDIKKLIEHINSITTKKLGIIAKIETKEAVFQVADIICEGLKQEKFGIMIARGDLAVEIGYKALPFAQESILHICKAAHIPVIWATGVLEKLTKSGVPSRAEMTDLTTGMEAQCIMLNKGPYILEATNMIKSFHKISIE